VILCDEEGHESSKAFIGAWLIGSPYDGVELQHSEGPDVYTHTYAVALTAKGRLVVVERDLNAIGVFVVHDDFQAFATAKDKFGGAAYPSTLIASVAGLIGFGDHIEELDI
jgi:hypothetical protein